MRINIRHSEWDCISNAQVCDGNTTIDLGALKPVERKALAKVFLAAAEELLAGLSDDPTQEPST